MDVKLTRIKTPSIYLESPVFNCFHGQSCEPKPPVYEHPSRKLGTQGHTHFTETVVIESKLSCIAKDKGYLPIPLPEPNPISFIPIFRASSSLSSIDISLRQSAVSVRCNLRKEHNARLDSNQFSHLSQAYSANCIASSSHPCAKNNRAVFVLLSLVMAYLFPTCQKR